MSVLDLGYSEAHCSFARDPGNERVVIPEGPSPLEMDSHHQDSARAQPATQGWCSRSPGLLASGRSGISPPRHQDTKTPFRGGGRVSSHAFQGAAPGEQAMGENPSRTQSPAARAARVPALRWLGVLVSWWFKTPYLELGLVLPSRRFTECRQTRILGIWSKRNLTTKTPRHQDTIQGWGARFQPCLPGSCARGAGDGGEPKPHPEPRRARGARPCPPMAWCLGVLVVCMLRHWGPRPSARRATTGSWSLARLATGNSASTWTTSTSAPGASDGLTTTWSMSSPLPRNT